MNRKIPFLLALYLVFGLSATFPARAAERVKYGIDWAGGYLRGVGSGTAHPSGNRVKDRFLAIRAAEVQAQRALAESIYGVRIDAVTTMRDAMKDSVVGSSVEGIVRGAQKVRTEVTWEGDVPQATVELRICIVLEARECRSSASLMTSLAERRIEPSYIPAVYSEDVPEHVTPESRHNGTPRTGTVSYDSSRPVTGLVLKVEGIPFERELFPVVVTRVEGGKLQTVFSARSVKPGIIRTHGVARYADSMDQALKDARLGGNPLVVTVSEVTRENMLLIRREGARAIRETTRYGNDYLNDAKVVIAGGRRY